MKDKKQKYRSLRDDEILTARDQMKRADWTEASTHEWFEIPKQDTGRRADYFNGSGFLLRRPVDHKQECRYDE